MKSLAERYGNWALVAGAAAGIGEGFTTMLAASGFSVILADRNAETMHTLALKIEQVYRVETRELHLDLSEPDASARCLQAAAENGCRLMVYVAAFSHVSRFTNLESADLDKFLSVNNRTLLHMVYGFSKRLAATGEPGAILLVSSLAGLLGPQYVATYAATKAFTIRLAESLHGEFREHGIAIMACCPGSVLTPAYLAGKPDFSKIKPPFMDAGETASYALKRLGRSTLCIPGRMNRLQYFFLLNLVPRRLASKLVNDAMKKIFGNAVK